MKRTLKDIIKNWVYGAANKLGIIDEVYSKYYNENDNIANNPDFQIFRNGDLTYTAIDSMLEYAQVFAGLMIRKLAIVGKGGYYKNTKYPEVAEYINSCVNNLDLAFEDYLILLLESLEWGWKSMECVWRIEGGIPVLKGFFDHLPDSTDICVKNDTGLPSPGKFVCNDTEIPASKCLYMVNHPRNKSPYGESILYAVYKHWFCVDKFLRYEAMSLERMGIPPVYVKINGMNRKNLNEAKTIIGKLHKEAGIAIPNTWDIGILESAKKGESSFRPAIIYHDIMILRGLLFPAGIIEEGKSGSYGMGDIRFELFKYATGFDRIRLAHVLNKQLFEPWVAMINPEAVRHGTWEWVPYEEIDWLKVSEGIKDLTDAGYLNPQIDKEYIREKILKIDSQQVVWNNNIKTGANTFLAAIDIMPSTVNRPEAMLKAKAESALNLAKVETEKENVVQMRKPKQEGQTGEDSQVGHKEGGGEAIRGSSGEDAGVQRKDDSGA